MTHECPGPGCAREVDSSMLMCPACWYQVPKPVRARGMACMEARRRRGHPGAPGGRDCGDSGGEPCLIRSPPWRHPLSTRPAALPWKACRWPGPSPQSLGGNG